MDERKMNESLLYDVLFWCAKSCNDFWNFMNLTLVCQQWNQMIRQSKSLANVLFESKQSNCIIDTQLRKKIIQKGFNLKADWINQGTPIKQKTLIKMIKSERFDLLDLVFSNSESSWIKLDGLKHRNDYLDHPFTIHVFNRTTDETFERSLKYLDHFFVNHDKDWNKFFDLWGRFDGHVGKIRKHIFLLPQRYHRFGLKPPDHWLYTMHKLDPIRTKELVHLFNENHIIARFVKDDQLIELSLNEDELVDLIALAVSCRDLDVFNRLMKNHLSINDHSFTKSQQLRYYLMQCLHKNWIDGLKLIPSHLQLSIGEYDYGFPLCYDKLHKIKCESVLAGKHCLKSSTFNLLLIITAPNVSIVDQHFDWEVGLTLMMGSMGFGQKLVYEVLNKSLFAEQNLAHLFDKGQMAKFATQINRNHEYHPYRGRIIKLLFTGCMPNKLDLFSELELSLNKFVLRIFEARTVFSLNQLLEDWALSPATFTIHQHEILRKFSSFDGSMMKYFISLTDHDSSMYSKLLQMIKNSEIYPKIAEQNVTLIQPDNIHAVDAMIENDLLNVDQLSVSDIDDLFSTLFDNDRWNMMNQIHQSFTEKQRSLVESLSMCDFMYPTDALNRKAFDQLASMRFISFSNCEQKEQTLVISKMEMDVFID